MAVNYIQIPNGFYVYEHWRSDTGACFYVGKGRGDGCRKTAYNLRFAYIERGP